jgi:hypothetical protein
VDAVIAENAPEHNSDTIHGGCFGLHSQRVPSSWDFHGDKEMAEQLACRLEAPWRLFNRIVDPSIVSVSGKGYCAV